LPGYCAHPSATRGQDRQTWRHLPPGGGIFDEKSRNDSHHAGNVAKMAFVMDIPYFLRQTPPLHLGNWHLPMATILVLHGPNLNLLGTREPEVYGSATLEHINQRLQQLCLDQGHHFLTLQSNAEYELIERIHDARREGVNFILFNPAAFTHTSVALRDALLASEIPFIEVHLSNVHAREAFRHTSYFSDIAKGVICGLGPLGYELALTAAMAQVSA
jgi:3-dehydroquinate dehydratase-2